MTSKLLCPNGHVIYCSTWHTVSREECKDETVIARMKDHDAKIKATVGDPSVKADPDADADTNKTPNFQLYEDDFSGVTKHVPDIDTANPDVLE